MTPFLAALAGYAAVAIGIASTVLQWQRLRRDGIDGISLATWVMFFGTGVFWVSYGLVSAHSLIVILGSGTVLPFQAYIIARLSPWRAWRTVLWSTGFVVLFSFAPIVVGGWSVGVYGTGLSMALMRVPQIVELARQRHADGVSAPAWYAGVLCSLLWLGYYAGVHNWAPFWSTGSAGLASLVVAVLTSVRHRQALADRALANRVAVGVEETSE
jgi:uncharacterized protein with PQ loop repeat